MVKANEEVEVQLHSFSLLVQHGDDRPASFPWCSASEAPLYGRSGRLHAAEKI